MNWAYRLTEKINPETLALLTIIAVLSLLTLFNLLHITQLPYPINYGEGPLLDQIIRLSESENIYRQRFNPTAQTISNYPPLMHLINVPFIKLFGPNYYFGRIINLFALIGCCILILLICKHKTNNLLAGIFGALAFFSLGRLSTWSTTLRVDSIAIFFEVLAIWLTINRPITITNVKVTASLTLLSILTRQSNGILACFTILYLLASERNKDFLLQYIKWLILLGIGALLFLYLLFGDGLYLHLVQSNVNKLSLSQLYAYMYDFINLAPVIWFSLPLLTYYLLATKKSRGILRMGVVMLLASLPTVIAMSKIGSASNYLMHFGIASSCIAAFVFSLSNSRWIKGILLFALVVQAENGRNISGSSFISDRNIEMMKKLSKKIKDTTGSIFGDEIMGYLPINNKKIQYQPFEMQQIHHTGIFPEKYILHRLQSQEFDLVVISNVKRPKISNAQRWSRRQLLTIARCYEFEERIFTEYIFHSKAKCSKISIKTKRMLSRIITLTNRVSRS